MGRAVDRRPAGVDPDVAGLDRLEWSGLAGQRVVEADRHPVAVRWRHRATRGLDDATGAPVARQVAGRRLDADDLAGAGREVARSRRASSAGTRRAGAAPATIVRSTDETVASRRRRAARRRPPGARCWRSRAGSPRRPGRAAEVAQPGRAEQGSAIAWRATSPSEWPWSRGAPGISMPPSRAPSPGPNGWLSRAESRRACGLPAHRRGDRHRARPARSRSSGRVTLRLLGSPGIAWTAMLQASSRAASSVHVARSGGWIPREARPQQRSADTLRRLGRRERLAVDGPGDRVPLDALDRLGDRHDRDRGAVSAAARATARTSSAEASGRAPSWTSTTRSRPGRHRRGFRGGRVEGVERRQPGRDRLVAPRAAGDHGDDLRAAARERPRARQHARPARDERRSDRSAGTAAIASIDQASSGLPSIEVGAACRARPSAGRSLPRGHDDPRRTGSSAPSHRRARSGPMSAGWAKTIRPATVWSTRVTVTSRSLSM